MMPENPTIDDFVYLSDQWEQVDARIDGARQFLKVLERDHARTASETTRSIIQERIARQKAWILTLGFQQQEIEEYLIENEAPGWTST